MRITSSLVTILNGSMTRESYGRVQTGMSEKSIREMSKYERFHHSLAARTFQATLTGAIIIGFTTLLVGLGLFTNTVAGQHVSSAFNTSRNAAAILEKIVDVRPFSRATMEAYRAQSDEERAQMGTEEYRARFASLTKWKEYETICTVLADFEHSADAYAVYLAMYDEETSAMVYLADPSTTGKLMPGEWESVTREGMEKFLNWDGSGILYDTGHTENYGWLCTSGTPIYDDDGKPIAFVLIDMSMENVVRGMRNYAVQFFVMLLVTMLLYGYLVTRHMKRTLVQPIDAIADAAQEYAEDRRSGGQSTQHFASLGIRTGDEIENLSLVLADMERDLANYEDSLTKMAAEKERIHTELSLANRIQADMLPSIFPAFPERAEFDVYASMNPAKEVGGDFYNFFLIDEDHLCLIIADVAGKGIPAALFMMASMIILSNNAMMGKSPAETLEDTNTMICSHNQEEMFVTVWLGILEISTGKLVAANAGHEYPVLRHADGRFEVFKDPHGFVIGGMDGIKYREYEIQLEPGTKIFQYTDGVPEAINLESEMFGLERMVATLNEDCDAHPEQLLENVKKSVIDFVGEAEQFDDLTMLCLEYRGKGCEDAGRQQDED